MLGDFCGFRQTFSSSLQGNVDCDEKAHASSCHDDHANDDDDHPGDSPAHCPPLLENREPLIQTRSGFWSHFEIEALLTLE